MDRSPFVENYIIDKEIMDKEGKLEPFQIGE
jgi:hypothetical protein